MARQPQQRQEQQEQQEQQHESKEENSTKVSPLLARIVSGTFGSIVTSLAVTPLEVAKVLQQADSTGPSLVTPSAPKPPPPPGYVECPRGCGTFILNNGHMDCIVPKSSVPYFDAYGRCVNITNVRGASWKFLSRWKFGTNGATTAATTTTLNEMGTIGTLRGIFRAEGLSGLYAGLGPTLVMSVPNTVLYYATYDEISSRLRTYRRHRKRPSDHNEKDADEASSLDHALIPLVAGSSARLLASTLTSPLELIRTRQASAVGQRGWTQTNATLLSEFRTIVRTDGSSALFRGIGPTLLRDVPFSGVYWVFLERFRRDLETSNLWMLGGARYNDGATTASLPPSIRALHSFLAGASAGMIAAFVTAPFDVVKTRMQMITRAVDAQSVAKATTTAAEGAVVYHPQTAVPSFNRAPPTVGTLSAMVQIVETEGIAGLWRGNIARMIKVAPACAIMITSYELGKRILGE